MPFTWSTTLVKGLVIRAAHTNEMKTNVDTIYTSLGINYSLGGCSGPGWVNLPATTNTTIRASDHIEIRDRISYVDDKWCTFHCPTGHFAGHLGGHDSNHFGTYHNGHQGGYYTHHRSTDHGVYYDGDFSEHNPAVETGYNGTYHGTYRLTDNVPYQATYFYHDKGTDNIPHYSTQDVNNKVGHCSFVYAYV